MLEIHKLPVLVWPGGILIGGGAYGKGWMGVPETLRSAGPEVRGM